VREKLSSLVVDIAELRSAYSDEIAELEKFLKEKIKVEIDVSDREITLKPGEKGEFLTKDYLKVLLKKYLHKSELREEFRIISGQENTLILKERKIKEES
jgi:hypothetical protein